MNGSYIELFVAFRCMLPGLINAQSNICCLCNHQGFQPGFARVSCPRFCFSKKAFVCSKLPFLKHGQIMPVPAKMLCFSSSCLQDVDGVIFEHVEWVSCTAKK